MGEPYNTRLILSVYNPILLKHWYLMKEREGNSPIVQYSVSWDWPLHYACRSAVQSANKGNTGIKWAKTRILWSIKFI